MGLYKCSIISNFWENPKSKNMIIFERDGNQEEDLRVNKISLFFILLINIFTVVPKKKKFPYQSNLTFIEYQIIKEESSHQQDVLYLPCFQIDLLLCAQGRGISY